MDEHPMPCWYYEKEELLHTPSFLSGIDHETEDRYRSEGARFIFDLGTKLRIPYDTCATAIVFFHRFYMLHSFSAFPRHVTAACCLMLAGKVEETPKKCRDIIRTARAMLPDHIMAHFGNDPREEVMMYERVLLKTIKFDLQVSHPYSFLLQYAKRIKGDAEKIKQLVQMAWSFINDSLATTLCLQWEPEIVACAVLYLATRMKKCHIEDWEGRRPGQRWWECFVEGMSTDVMEDICHKILDLYPSSDASTSRQSTSLESAVHRRESGRPSAGPSGESSSIGIKRPRPSTRVSNREISSEVETGYTRGSFIPQHGSNHSFQAGQVDLSMPKGSMDWNQHSSLSSSHSIAEENSLNNQYRFAGSISQSDASSFDIKSVPVGPSLPLPPPPPLPAGGPVTFAYPNNPATIASKYLQQLHQPSNSVQVPSNVGDPSHAIQPIVTDSLAPSEFQSVFPSSMAPAWFPGHTGPPSSHTSSNFVRTDSFNNEFGRQML